MSNSNYEYEDKIIAKIENRLNKDQFVNLVYLPSLNAFITDGIYEMFGHKEILVPAYMVVKDIELVGAIISIVLEEMTVCSEKGTEYRAVEKFELFGSKYVLIENPLFYELTEEKEEFINI